MVLESYTNMTDNTKREFPDWEKYYQDNEIEKMPWYEKNLDPDLEYEIKARNINRGRFLDLGTGPGTQAIQLARLGFDVTGVDISVHAIQKAKELSTNVNFVRDDFVKSKLPDDSFDYILDRGCFHVFEPFQRRKYVKQIKRILDRKGILFLKCFSEKETTIMGDKGPHRFSKQEIEGIFNKDFVIESIKDTVYHGTLDPLPKALFVVMRKKINL
jgi:SAM-dependent methyltransferase